MAKRSIFSKALAISASLSVVTLAACVNQPITQPSNNPPASGQPSSPAPANPSATPGSPTPVLPGNTPDTSARTTVHGVIYDDLQQRLSDVTVSAKVLGAGTFANGSDTLVTQSQVGSYALNGVPSGSTVLVSVSKSGYTTRQQTLVPLANLAGDTDFNRIDFGMRGGAFDAANAMSDKPEVQGMTPQADATGIDPATSFTLHFSEPVNKTDVENHFGIAVATDNAAGFTLSNGVQLPQTYTPNNDRFNGTAQLAAANATFTSSAFDFAWSNNFQTVTVSFRPGYKLPTDKDASKLPQYAIGFGGAIRDAAGSGTRLDTYFRTNPAQSGKNGFRFTVAADTTAPRLIGITTVNNSGANNGNDQVRLQFSETMVLFPSNLGGGAVSIPNTATTAAKSVLSPANYEWYQQTNKPAAYGTGSAFGTGVVLWDGDQTQSTIVASHNSPAAFGSGQDIWAGVAATVEDPAGNAIETANGSNLKSGRGM